MDYARRGVASAGKRSLFNQWRSMPTRLPDLNHPRDREDIADGLIAVDSCGVPFKGFRSGVGPYGEPQLLRAIAETLGAFPPTPVRWLRAGRPTFSSVGSGH